MAFRFPFSTLHELNLDWILEQVKRFAELNPQMENVEEQVEYAVDTANEAKSMIEQAVTIVPCDSEPVMDGTETAGELNEFSRGDHVHPSDTSKADVSALADKVNKSGDTMTGTLRIVRDSESGIALQNTSMDFSASSRTADTSSLVAFLDENDELVGNVTITQLTTGVVRMGIVVRKRVNGEVVSNALTLSVDNAGNQTVGVTDPVAWRTALGIT